MGFEISGYVLEGIRVGQSNAIFTQTPDNYISNQGAFDAAYPADESAPRTDYLVLVTSEGVTHPGLVELARFGLVKNEVVQRFTYDALAGSFKPLRGSAPVAVGVLSADSNTTRLRVRPPVQVVSVPAAPYRLAIGGAGSGVTWGVTLVATDSGFNSPLPGFVELSMETGNLNWNASDLGTFAGQSVRFQQQQFYDLRESTGNIGTARISVSDPDLVLNPLPGPGQFPRLRFGHGFYLATAEVNTEGAFTVPPVGTVQWARSTGCLNFNPLDAANHAGVAVYYDGVLSATELGLAPNALGTIGSPSPIPVPPPGADLIFTLPGASPYYRFPSITYRPAANFNSGRKGEVQVDPSTGQVQFSSVDQSRFAGEHVVFFLGDLLIERGISVRLLRNPVNLDAARNIKDVTEIYEVEGATWADPIIQSAQVSLPSPPIEDPGYPTVVRVIQGQGTYTSDNFPDLNVPSPPVGLGYYIDYDRATFFFAQRKVQQLVPIQTTTSDVVLPDPLLLPSNLTLELETGPSTGVYAPLVVGDDAIVDTTAGVVSLTSTNALVSEGTASISGTTVTDGGAQFLTDGVQSGYVFVLANENVYTVSLVISGTSLQLDLPVSPAMLSAPYAIYENREVLADRYFDEVVLVDPSTKVERIRALGTASNSPRLNVPIAYVASSGFRLGSSQEASFAEVVLVPDDSAFGTVPESTVQISEYTGNLNFAVADLGTLIYWSRKLTPKADYRLQPELGLVQFADRLLSEEEARITYTVAPPSTNPATAPEMPVTEYARFLVRKEITQPHPSPTSTLSFNPAGLLVASDPPPAVFRGGRPQKLNTQCTVDTTLFQLTFLPDRQNTDALPHGATVSPNERVYIDYYVTQAVGGEKTFTVLQPPILTSVVNIDETDNDGNSNNQFEVFGDQTARFPAGHLMRLETEQVYLIGSSSYDGGSNKTTIALYGNQVFQDPFTDPKVYVSSGPTSISAVPLVPSYFTAELQSFEPVARGSNTFLISGDQTSFYRPSTVVLFTDVGSTFTNFLQVSGSAYDVATDRTTVMLSANAIKQYVPGQQLLLRSVRPIFEPPVTAMQTSRVPKLTQPYLVYRRATGASGQVLTVPVGYTINDSGSVVFADSLAPFEELSILYTGLTPVAPGRNLRASYTNQIAPTATNGLLGQTLLADYFVKCPDTFYYRVETMNNFRGEYAAEIEADANSGSSGPQTSNASQPDLWEQGRKSLYFDERHLSNQDVIARSTLLFYNDLINGLEAYRRFVDGTVVGNNDGRLIFDGSAGSTHPPGSVTNQIDDTIKVSNAPYAITFPPFAVTPIGTYRKYYVPGPLSRFYPTARRFFGVSTVDSNTVTGDEVLDTRSTNVTQVANLHTRLAWAVVTESTLFSGGNTLKVDFALGTEPGFDSQAEAYARPPFKNGMKCLVQARNGSFINASGNPVTITNVSANQLTISGGLAATVNVGDTVFRDPADDSLQSDPDRLVNYVAGQDYSFHGEPGQVTYIGPTTPPGDNTPLVPNQALFGEITLANTLTAPFQFPALFGGIEDDDGDLGLPVQTPDPNSEQHGYLFTENKLVGTGIGAIRTRTTAPITSTGSVNSPNFTTIVDAAIGSMFPAPQQHDLVRILTGTNGGSAFRRIAFVGVGSLTVDTPYLASAGFAYELAVSPTLASGTATSGAVYQLTDTTASFMSTVEIGHTIVFPTTGHRRQIYKINTNTTLSFSPSLPFSVVLGTQYRVENSLATYGDANSGQDADLLVSWSNALSGELALYPLQQAELLIAIDQVSTDVATGATGQTIATQATLIDSSATFLDDGVASGQFIYVVSGFNAGVYEIQSVDSQTQVTATGQFAATLSGISYRIVTLFGMSGSSVQALFTLYKDIAALISPLAVLQDKLSQAPVTGFDSGNTWANSLVAADLDTRESQVLARLAAISAISTQVEDILANTDQLYDKRYVWIDTRINLEDGLLVQQEAAIKNRIKAQADVLKQLTKLLAVEGA